MDVMTPSSAPNSESIPSVNNIRKKRTDQNGAAGNWLMASVNTMNARPVPELDCASRKSEAEVFQFSRRIRYVSDRSAGCFLRKWDQWREVA